MMSQAVQHFLGYNENYHKQNERVTYSKAWEPG